ncbi:MAG: alpha-methylacyl-CoA racemase [Oceanospirillaceae bacterium]
MKVNGQLSLMPCLESRPGNPSKENRAPFILFLSGSIAKCEADLKSTFSKLVSSKTAFDKSQSSKLDLERLAGPLATLWMAQQGAEVIKVESPHSPDPVRFYPPMKNGVSVFYSALNAGKKSISLDYRSDEGREQILKLVESADVVMEQFRPGVMGKFGLGYDQLKARNPKVVLVSITGYGQEGEMANMPGHDLNYLAYSGMLDGLRDKDGAPAIPKAQLADVSGGSMMALNAVNSALLHKERTGEGQHIDVSMAKNVSVLQSLRIAEELEVDLPGEHLSGRLACYNVYKCADGKYVALGALEPKFWQKFCNLIGHPEWGVRILDQDQTGLKKEVGDLFNSESMSYWLEKLENEGVCLSPVLTLKEASKHPLFKSGFPASFGQHELIDAPEQGASNDEFLG